MVALAPVALLGRVGGGEGIGVLPSFSEPWVRGWPVEARLPGAAPTSVPLGSNSGSSSR